MMPAQSYEWRLYGLVADTNQAACGLI